MTDQTNINATEDEIYATLNMMSRRDRKELEMLLSLNDTGEWDRTYEPIEKYKKSVKSIRFHAVGSIVDCYIIEH